MRENKFTQNRLPSVSFVEPSNRKKRNKKKNKKLKIDDEQ